MADYNVQLFYDPRRVGARFIQDVYAMFGLESPSEEELRTPFHTDEKTGREVAATRFSTPQKEKVLKLTDIVMGLPTMRIEIQSASE